MLTELRGICPAPRAAENASEPRATRPSCQPVPQSQPFAPAWNATAPNCKRHSIGGFWQVQEQGWPGFRSFLPFPHSPLPIFVHASSVLVTFDFCFAHLILPLLLSSICSLV